MAGVQVVVTGTADVQRRLALLQRRAADLGDPLDIVAAKVATDARARAPKVSGRLAASISPSSTRLGSGATASAPYAGPINYGWRRRGIDPAYFMQRAADPIGPFAALKIRLELHRTIKAAGLG